MNFLRKHWFDIGIALAVFFAASLALSWSGLTAIERVLWISLVTLFVHQFEEYRLPGGFPQMMNTAMFKSDMPDRWPLNSNTALLVNVVVGWLAYLLGALLAEQAIWLGIAATLVSAGNFVAHAFLFNIKGRTKYNPGMASAVILFLPVVAVFYYFVVATGNAGLLDWIGGILLGVALNVIGILKAIDWLKDRNTRYVFLPPATMSRVGKGTHS